MKYYEILFVFIVLLGAFQLSYSIFRMTIIDAKSRHFKHSHFLGLFTMGRNSSNLILYLLGRRNYPSIMSLEDQQKMDSYKKCVGVALVFIALGTISLIISEVLF